MGVVSLLFALAHIWLAASSPAQPQTPEAAPAAAVPPGTATPSAAASPAAVANMRWEGLVRRNAGVVLLKSRWDVGVLEFRQETVRWTDAKDPGKSLLIPGTRVKEQFQTCTKSAQGTECFEWGFKTAEATFVFRDLGWEKGSHLKVAEIYEFMKAIYPELPSTQVAGSR